MTRFEFLAECGKRLIDVGLALEHDGIRQALMDRDRKRVLYILDNEI